MKNDGEKQEGREEFEAEIFGPEVLERMRGFRIERSKIRHPSTYTNRQGNRDTQESWDTRGQGMAGLLDDVRGDGWLNERVADINAQGDSEDDEIDSGLLEKILGLTKDQRDVIRELWQQNEAEMEIEE